MTANNRFVAEGPGSPYYFCTDCHPSYRARRVEQLLAALPAATIDDMSRIHGDVQSFTAPLFQKQLRELALQPGEAGRLQKLIVEWDARMAADSHAAAAYAALRWHLAALLLERSGLGVTPQDILTQVPPGVVPVNQLWWALPNLVRTNDVSLLGGADWNHAFSEALARTANSHDGRTWGEYHCVVLSHPLAAQFPLNGRLNPVGAAMGGDNDTVMANGCLSSGGLKAMYGAVARYVFDVGAWDNSRWIVFAGASGHANSPHYADQHQAWSECRMVPMLYDWNAIASESGQLTLQPA